MKERKNPLRKPLLLARLLTFFIGYLILISSSVELPASKHQDRAPKLFKNNRELLATLRARGEEKLTVMIATTLGATDRVALEIAQLGGEVRCRADDVGYIRAIVTLDKVFTLAGLKGVQNLDIDINYYKIDPTLKYPPPKEKPSSDPPDPDTPLSNPALPTEAIDAENFHEENPTFDGRGVGVAIVDGNVDMLLPELQNAKALDGKEIVKIADILCVSDPIYDDDPMWVNMEKNVETKNKKYIFQDEEYTAPEEGVFRFGLFDERALKSPTYLYQDVNFDGNPEGSSGQFGILWDEKTNTIWVDTNQDKSFADEKPMTDYAKRSDIGVFGKDNPKTPRRESVAFAVQADKKSGYIRLNLGVWQHGTMVAGAAVGNGFYNGKYSSIAGEAQLISIFPGPGVTMHGLVEGAILAARHEKVDVICIEPAIPIPIMYSLCDGRLVGSIIFDRLVDKYQKLIFCPANNTFGMMTILDYIVGTKVIGANAYQTGESYKVNYGAEVAKKDNLHFVGSFGPAGNGALVPDILSPSAIISTDCGYKPPAKRKGVYELPPGYKIASGTSTAAPSATAACALLISAAKQSGIRWEADRLRHAIFSSARFIKDLQAHQQGNGLIQVNAAWKILKALNESFDPIDINSLAPVNTALSYLNEKPDQGTGIFEREGWTPGRSENRTVAFKRLSGKKDPITFDLEWLGNDGTFSCPDKVKLPLNQAVDMQITVSPKTRGVHSAILNLRQEDQPKIVYQMLNTVVAVEPFSDSNSYSLARKAEVERPGTKSFFFYVPPYTQAFQLDLVHPDKQKVRISLFSPYGADDLFWDLSEHGHWRKVMTYPIPGVWEVLIWNNMFAFEPDEVDSKPLTSTSVSLTGKLLSVEAEPSTWKIQINNEEESYSQKIDFINKLASFNGMAGSLSLGSEFAANFRISAQEQQVFDIKVPPGTDALKVKIEDVGKGVGDLDLYLFEVVKGIAVLREKSIGKSANEYIFVEKPNAGKWKAVVDAFSVEPDSIEYSYGDLFLHGLFGKVSTSDEEAQRLTGTRWTVEAKARIAAIPVLERVLKGIVPIVWLPVAGKKGEFDKSENSDEQRNPVIISTVDISLVKEK